MKGTSTMIERMDRETWSKKLGAFRQATQSAMQLCAALAGAALLHFNEHGDVIYLNELLEAIPENYGRRAAYVKWAADHAPLGMRDGKFIKDKAKAEKLNWDNPDGEVKAALLKKAQEKEFWDYVPAPKPVIITEGDAVDNIFSLVARIRKVDDTRHPTNKALSVASALEGFAISLRQRVTETEDTVIAAETQPENTEAAA